MQIFRKRNMKKKANNPQVSEQGRRNMSHEYANTTQTKHTDANNARGGRQENAAETHSKPQND